MTGVFGIIRRDGGPVEPAQQARLVDAIAAGGGAAAGLSPGQPAGLAPGPPGCAGSGPARARRGTAAVRLRTAR